MAISAMVAAPQEGGRDCRDGVVRCPLPGRGPGTRGGGRSSWTVDHGVVMRPRERRSNVSQFPFFHCGDASIGASRARGAGRRSSASGAAGLAVHGARLPEIAAGCSVSRRVPTFGRSGNSHSHAEVLIGARKCAAEKRMSSTGARNSVCLCTTRGSCATVPASQSTRAREVAARRVRRRCERANAEARPAIRGPAHRRQPARRARQATPACDFLPPLPGIVAKDSATPLRAARRNNGSATCGAARSGRGAMRAAPSTGSRRISTVRATAAIGSALRSA